MSAKRLAPLLLALTLAACQVVATVPPIPTPQVWQVEVTPALGWLGPGLNHCLQSLPGQAIAYTEISAASLAASSADVFLRWEAPADLTRPAFQVGADRLAVVVHPDNPLREMERSRLQGIFSGAYATWAEACPECSNLPTGAIELWTYAPGDDVQDLVETLLLGDAPLAAGAYLAASPADVLTAISENPAAIGYLPAAWLSESSLVELKVSGIPSADLTRPILAITAAEPSAEMAAWFACLGRWMNGY